MAKDVEEMREIDPEADAISYSDSGHESDIISRGGSDDADSQRDDRSDISTVVISDSKEIMKRMAKERLHKCVVCMNEFWKVILFFLQAGVLGGMGLLAYYMEFMELFPHKHTVFDCDDRSISQTMNTTVFEYFIFGNNIDESWVYIFSWMAPPGLIILVEVFYMMHTGCALSHHLKTPLILRRTFRIIGNYFFGVIGVLIVAKSMKIFLATPRPYFLHVCKPNVTFCMEATEEICTTTNHTELDDARTSFPSMPISALAYANLFLGAYLHQMIKNAKAFVLQPMAATMFLMLALLGACIEIGTKRSHWYDVAAGFMLGLVQAAYQVATLNFFVEKFQPTLPPKLEDSWMQTDPMPEPESDGEYPYEDIMVGKLPKRQKRYIDDSTCFHRATSFDSSFQSDMARSVKMFRDMNSVWNANSPPLLEPDTGIYTQKLPEIQEKPEEIKDSLSDSITPSSPVQVHIEAEVELEPTTE